MGVIAEGCKIFPGKKNVLKLVAVMVIQLCEYIKIPFNCAL